MRTLGARVLLMAIATLAVPSLAAAQMPLVSHSTAPDALRPGDLVRISVWPNSELGGEFVVEESGNVYLPMLGAVTAAGMSVDDLRVELRENYRQYVNNAVITVTPAFSVGVLGAVRRPGLYTVSPTNTLFDVIALAGGFSPEADEETVRVVREGEVIRVDALRALQLGEGLSALELRSGDQIIVDNAGRGFEFRNLLSVLQSAVLLATVIERLR